MSTAAVELFPPVEPQTTMTVSAARANLADVVKTAHGAPVLLTSRGRKAAVVVDAGTYQRLIEEWQDLRDVAFYDQAKAEDDGDRIPWDEVKRDLGLE